MLITRKSKSTVAVLPDLMVSRMLFVYYVVVLAISVWFYLIPDLYPVKNGSESGWEFKAFAIVGVVHLPVIILFDPERYITWFRFAEEGIEYHIPFRKTQLLPYQRFPYIRRGGYLHGVFWRDFIVFSNRLLTEEELQHINHVAPSKKLIKIRYSEKTKQKLLKILPPKQRATVAAITPARPKK